MPTIENSTFKFSNLIKIKISAKLQSFCGPWILNTWQQNYFLFYLYIFLFYWRELIKTTCERQLHWYFPFFKIFQSPVKWEVIYISISQKLTRQGLFIVKKRCKQKIRRSQSGEWWWWWCWWYLYWCWRLLKARYWGRARLVLVVPVTAPTPPTPPT